MKIAFLADPLDSFKIHKDSTYAMMVEAEKRYHQLYAFEHSDVRLMNGQVRANVGEVVLRKSATSWYQKSEKQLYDLSDFDVVVVRKDPPFDMEYVYLTHLLSAAQKQGARIVNDPQALRNHNEKLSIMEFSNWITPTLMTRDMDALHEFHQQHRDIILKPIDKMGGQGVFRIQEDGLNLSSTIEVLTNNGQETIMAQRYIPAISRGDKRILLIAGKVVPFALARIPKNNEVRANLAAGGLGVAQALSLRDQEIANNLAPLLFRRGFLLVGLDIIGDYLTEINVTSPTCFQEITQQTGYPVAKDFIDALEKMF